MEAIDVAAEPLYLHLSILDPEVATALAEAGEGRDRQEYALTALRIGILSLKAARGTVDGETVRHAGERLMASLDERFMSQRHLFDQAVHGTLRRYFDPSDGQFTERVQRLLSHDGDLATVVGQQVEAARRTLDAMFEQHLGEQSELRRLLSADEGNAFIEALRGQVGEALQRQGDAITAEFTLDNPSSALCRFVRELEERHGVLARDIGCHLDRVVGQFSLDDEHSALSRLKKGVETVQDAIGAQFSLDNEGSGLSRIKQQIERIESQQREQAHALELKVTTLLEKLVTRREQAQRSNAHGAEFEARVGEALRHGCLAADDVMEDVGAVPGARGKSKVGDFVVQLGHESAAPGACIVVEAKASGAHTLKKTLEEAEQARANRDASVCLFVHSARTAPAGIPELHRWGHDVVVLWDESDPATDIRLKAGYLVARALALRSAAREEGGATLVEMDSAIEAIRLQLGYFEEIQTSARTVVSGGQKIENRALRMQTALEQRLVVLQQVAARLRGEAARAA